MRIKRLQLLEADPAHGRAVMKAPRGTGDALLLGMKRGDFNSPKDTLDAIDTLPNFKKKSEKGGM
jgi:hypothetical protein